MGRFLLSSRIGWCAGFALSLMAVGAPGQTAAGQAAAGPRVTLRGNHPAFAIPEARKGPVAPQFRLDRMVLLLRPTAAQQLSLDALAAAQQDQGSPLYHHWLTPEEYGAEFGLPLGQLARMDAWLAAQGLRVEAVGASRRLIVFSSTAAQVDAAFHAGLARYAVRGAERIGNAADPVIPAEFAEQIAGIVGLDDTRSRPQHAVGAFTAGATHYLAPADVAVIYDVAPLQAQGTLGAGAEAESGIAVLARSNLLAEDVADFRNAFGLGANAPVVLVNGVDPGIANAADFEETEMDAEWAGAMAPKATVDVVASASTATTDGILLSAEYAVDHDVAPVIALSYAECEGDLGQAGNTMLAQLWEQAAVEGISVVVAAGDAGAAGCDDAGELVATAGRAVNGMCSTPWSVCVGGTEFAEESGAFWASDNNADGLSALAYIPETAWNESGAGSGAAGGAARSGAGGLWAGGGGVSAVYARPAWQEGVLSARRAVPDVSLSSAGHDPYLVWIDGAQTADSGTSAAAQVFAGIAALLVEEQGERLGNLDVALYAIAAAHPSAFHDVVSGNNSVPGVNGFAAAPGYDEATGLGSVDAALLAEDWPAGWLHLGKPRCATVWSCHPLPVRPRPLSSP